MARVRLLGLVAILFWGLSHCAADASAKGNVKVSILIIVASESNGRVDPKLKCIADEVREVDPRLKGFRVANMICKSLPPQTRESFDLINDQKATVVIEHAADRNNRVTLRLTPPMLNEITYTTCCGKFLPIITRYRPKPDERLILAVRVQPCNGK